ncbi:MAG TPA: tetratricopeptide repeat protein [Polyangiaceae bacterium]|nr:tetratricopeptide repeat protein [Polyangiaceae bacterium]
MGLVGLVGLAGCAKPPPPISQAALLSEKGQDAAAIQVLVAHVHAHPDAIPERRMLIRLYGATGDLGKAEEQASELSRRLPDGSPVPLLEMGHVLELSHRYDEALEMYDRAAEIAPKDPAGPRTGGLRAARWGEAELAAPRLEEALRRDPRDAVVWHALGLVRTHLGDIDGARVAYRSGLMADPNALENRVGLATVALRSGDASGALAQYDQILAARPGFAAGHLGRAWSLIRLGRLDEARTALDEAARLGADARVIERQRRLLARLAREHRDASDATEKAP